MNDWITIRSDRLTAAINPLGAELSSLRDAQGRELMTDADPAFWTGRAPILFPVVGRVHDDAIRIGGRRHPMAKHGIARRSHFDVAEAMTDRASFRLVDSLETRAAYPFAFLLEITFAIDAATLVMTAKIGNIGDEPLPASFGWHPAFAWPLPFGSDRSAHRVVFEQAEPGLLTPLSLDGFIAAPTRPSPVTGNVLALDDQLFADDALIWDPVESRSLRYGPSEGPWLDIAWDAPRLGIWTKPGARYLCIEPWHGIADPEGFAGEYRDKPGVVAIAPGDRWQCEMRVTLTQP
jgi:galactose mutarotase-like enzyme